MLVAIDDTDSVNGGCTTHLVFEALLAVPEVALQGMPRLIRLNPNVPWKTRGNAAIVLPLVVPHGPYAQVGEFRGHEIRAYPDGTPIAPAARDEICRRIWAVVESLSQQDAKPALVATTQPLSPAIYREAATRLVDFEELEALELPVIHHGSRAAFIGCVGALAYPGPPSSYEFIAYREPRNWGTPRQVRTEAAKDMDSGGITFHSWDREANRACFVPSTPCPVLLGIRGWEPEGLQATSVAAVRAMVDEPVDGWILWASNQASGDHVVEVGTILDAPAYSTVSLCATVEEKPVWLDGGRVEVACVDESEVRVTAVAFEPTKSFRHVVAQLLPGDQVILVGAFSKGAIQLEKLCITAQMPRSPANPSCQCGDRMKSRGKGAGFKCPSCKEILPPATPMPCNEWHEVPVIARRHLHRPLARD